MQKYSFIFPGQGSQIVGMGKEMYDSFPEAKAVFQEVDDALGQKLSDIIFNGSQEDLTKTENAQPALMAVSIATLKCLEKQGVFKTKNICNFVAGHSLGEYSALTASNAISIGDSAKILRIRGNAMAEAGKSTKGSMAAIIGVDLAKAQEIADNAIGAGEICQIANDNSVGQIVVSGSENAINKVVEIAKSMGARMAIKLPVSGAFHSKLIESAEDELRSGLGNITINTPEIPIISNVTAQPVTDVAEIKNLLAAQITSVVRWRESMLYLKDQNSLYLAEIGAGKVLTGLAKRIDSLFLCTAINTPNDIDDFLKSANL
jgi:[acyl-carrier-protein] S-malonyltransferase